MERAAEMVARSVGQLGPVACEHANFEFCEPRLEFSDDLRGLRARLAGSASYVRVRLPICMWW